MKNRFDKAKVLELWSDGLNTYEIQQETGCPENIVADIIQEDRQARKQAIEDLSENGQEMEKGGVLAWDQTEG